MKKIRIIESGPYEVMDVPTFQAELVPYKDEPGATESWRKGLRRHGGNRPYLLCRCGHSANKPFCDASHYMQGFVGKEVADRSSYEKACKIYAGVGFDLMDRARLCVIARFCDVGIGAWELTQQSDNPENAEKAKRVASLCPSGRLTIRTKDGIELETDTEEEIFAVEDCAEGHHGPLYVQGDIILESADNSNYENRNRRALCRCGESSNIPFCDASHLRCDHMKLDS